MKKFLCTFALIFMLVCSLLSCNGNSDNASHTHAFGKWQNTTEPTCVSEGQAERICDCGEKEIKVLSKLTSYNLGDKVEDLKFVVDDGSTFSLYETLKKSKAALLVFDLNSFNLVQNALNSYPDAEAVGIANTNEYYLLNYKTTQTLYFSAKLFHT